MKKLFFWPDTHAPYHSEKAVAVALEALKSFSPDLLFMLGDFADMYSVSAHSKHPSRKAALVDELVEANILLRTIERAAGPECGLHFCEGNHEDRLQRYIADKAPEMFNAVGIDGLLNLTKNGWKFHRYRKHVKVGHLYVTHDIGYAGQNAARQTVGLYQGNVVFGHTHQLHYLIEGNVKGKAHVGMSCGWLGDFEAIDYMHQAKSARFWQHGFGVGYLLDNGDVHLQPVPIVNGQCVIEGKVVKP